MDKRSWIERALGAIGLGSAPAAAPSPGAAAADSYEYQPQVPQITFEEAVAILERRGHRVVPYGVDNYNPAAVQASLEGLARAGVRVEGFPIDVAAFEEFRAAAGYATRYPQYYGTGMPEKQLEHFLTMRLLELAPGDVFVDVASEDSPVPEIYARLTGAQTYWQDIQYEPGMHGHKIGGDACAMPVPDAFASAVALTCSIEHFERDADQRLCDELVRVIRPGGRFVIAPLYLNPEPAAITDPVYSAQADVPFDPGVPLHCARDWRNRHGRFYSPQTLRERLLTRLEPAFDVAVKRITNFEAIPGQPYLRFALVGRRRPA